MWRDILNIHPDCEEYFLNFESLPGNTKHFIACGGVSLLQNEYQIGKTGLGEYLGEEQRNRIHVHYLIATHDGAGKLSVGDKTYEIRPGSVMLIPAGTPFLYELDGDYWDMCWLLLHDCNEYEFIKSLDAGVWSSDQASLLYNSMSLLRDYDYTEGHYHSDIQLRLTEILLFQINQTINQQATQTEQQKRFHRLLQTVNKQLQLPWTVTELAQQMHLSEPQFFRLCKKETGMTPMKLLTKSRLDYACYLLRYTNYNLEQIADTIGYADSASFAHRFKQQFGISPGRWRNGEAGSKDKEIKYKE